MRVGRLNKNLAGFPVDSLDTPASASEGENHRFVGVASCDRHLVHLAEFFSTMDYCQQWRCRKNGEQFHEVAPSEILMCLVSQAEVNAVRIENLLRQQVVENLLKAFVRQGGKGRQSAQPASPVANSQSVQLECERHQLLRENVQRLRWRLHRFDKAVEPQLHNGTGAEKGVGSGREEETIT